MRSVPLDGVGRGGELCILCMYSNYMILDCVLSYRFIIFANCLQKHHTIHDYLHNNTFACQILLSF